MVNVLVTGGAGFIGSHLVDELISRGYNVVILDNLSTGFLENINSLAKFVKGDIRDKSLVEGVMKNVDYVFHLAAEVSVVDSMKNPAKTVEVNTLGSLNVLQSALKNNVKKVVLASSAAVYGDNKNLPLTELDLPQPKSPYGITKLSMENYARMYNSLGLKTVCLRGFNIYGPRQNPNSQYAAVIPHFISRALEDEDLLVYGDGKQTRDFVYVKDMVKAYLLAMEKGIGIFNIGNGGKVSIIQLARVIRQVTKSNSRIKHSEARQGDIRHSISSIRKAKKVLGFCPLYSLTRGLKETVNSLTD